jgi:RNase P subunit RPR2
MTEPPDSNPERIINNTIQKDSERKKEIQKQKTKKFNKSRERRPTRYRKQEEIMQVVAKERIIYLMKRAIEIASKNQELADHYVDLCRRYSMAAKEPIPQEYKKLICHGCKKLMIPGVTCRTRFHSAKGRGSRYIITCLRCNHMVQIYFKSKKSTTSENVTEINTKTKANTNDNTKREDQ